MEKWIGALNEESERRFRISVRALSESKFAEKVAKKYNNFEMLSILRQNEE